MSTKIELEYPFNLIWRLGYIVTNKENRRNVILYNSSKDRSTISYARYLVSVQEGRLLRTSEEVDHIDNDKTNDDLSNLQILGNKEHRLKTNAAGKYKDYVFLTCPVCYSGFVRRSGQILVDSPKCSRECRSICSTALIKRRDLFTDYNDQIRKLVLEGKTCYYIAKLLDLKKSSVEYYVRTRLK